jgi:tRNA(Ile)-lysidine synthase
LHALAERGLDIVAAHVDHGLRPESADQALQVAEIAGSLGVRCEVRRIDLPAYQTLTGWGVQQAARAARYQVLASIVADVQAQALLVAHTADDQAETVLLNLLRGAGLKGLAGMRLDETLDPIQLGLRLVHAPPMRVARPLLRVSRATTLAYCQELGLARVEDPSNLSGAYTRNRVRLELLPLLERFNPGVRGVLARTADLAAEDEQALDDLAHAQFAALAVRVDPDVLELQLAPWRQQPRALRRRMLRLGLATLLGRLVDVPDAPIEDALDLLDTAPAGRAYHLPGGVELSVQAGRFVLRLHGQAQAPKRSKTWGIAPPRV